ncbi:uncharacterized protein LOC108092300 [Drosophila ficusphila]|uniref:uncharacterized protein LOC108092300 n=1 Tax=Drosophila ficusphila TaxID=30025 RepID=UPI0007E6C373|nr:uncharacterized protein LOC108092300 [Drosophila ficusphila]
MDARRLLLIVQILACLIFTISACKKRSCQPFTGWNNCVDNGIKEPKLPPRDNTCCGPQCVYTAPEPPKLGPCNCAAKGRCLLDTHCTAGMPFTYVTITRRELDKQNAARLEDGYAPILSIDWDQETCLSMNTKCGINCCCRENCPTLFCKF